MTETALLELRTAALVHYDNARADIANATTRSEHIRLTGLAIEAGQLLTRIDNMLALCRRDAVS